MYMNAQYLIVHDCKANTNDADSDVGVGCSDSANVKFYGRTSTMSAPVEEMLREIAQPRTCVVLDNMSTVRTNGL